MDKKLPKLPYGEGSLTWGNDEHTIIYYRKQIGSKRVHVTGKSVRECLSLMKEEEKKVEKISQLEKSDKTLSKGMGEWLEIFKKPSVNERSFDRIESTFNTHIKDSFLGNMQEDAIDSKDIQSFINNLTHSKNTNQPLSYSSKKKVYELLDQYFKYHYAKNPQNNPMTFSKPPKKSDSEVLKSQEDLEVWNDEEMMALTKAGIESGGNELFVIFLMWSFCRIGEALALTNDDFDIDNKEIIINKSISRVRCRSGSGKAKYEIKVVPTKNKKKRSVKLCRYAYEALLSFKGNLPVGMSIMAVTRAYGRLIKKSGIDSSKHVTLHGLRHSGISYFLRHGVPVEVVSRMAGHSSIDITQNIYYSVLKEQKEKAINDLDGYLSSNMDL